MSEMRDQIAEAIREAIRQAPKRPALGYGGVTEVGISMHDLADAVMRVIEPALLAEQVAATERADTLAGRLQQAEELLQIGYETSNRSERERVRAVERAEQAEAAVERVRAAIESAQKAIAFTSRDMAPHPLDAWLYGIFLGWDCDDHHDHTDDCDAMTDLAIQHDWTDETVARLREHHASIAALDRPGEDPPVTPRTDREETT